eukprot:1051314-Rhodomonas_salina.1
MPGRQTARRGHLLLPRQQRPGLTPHTPLNAARCSLRACFCASFSAPGMQNPVLASVNDAVRK